MSGLLYLPWGDVWMASLQTGGCDDPRLMIPLIQGEMLGLQYRRVRPGGDLERPSLPISWIVTVDDRAPGASGPSSFDPGTLGWLFADASLLAADAVEPCMELYEYFVEEGLKGNRVLVIRTIESRVGMWREFSRQRCELYGILEIVPIRNNPKLRFATSVTRFDRQGARKPAGGGA
jgi:hypothetical protein